MKWIVAIVDMLFFLWAVLAMLRFFLQKGGLSYNHPFAIFLYRSNQCIVARVRRYVSPIKGWDMAIILSVFIVFLGYEFLKLIINIMRMEIALNLFTLFAGTMLTVLLKTFSVLAHAIWFQLIAWYFLYKNSKDRQLFQAYDFSLKQLFSLLNLTYKPRLVSFVICTVWVFVLYPNILYWIQTYIGLTH